MCSALGAIGICWGITSVLSSLLTAAGFFFPFWIEGELLGNQRTSFGSFVRCGYPQLTEDGVIEILSECGRYASFWIIPSPWWQLSTVLVGTGATINLLIAISTLFSICFSDLLNSTSAKFIGYIQILTGLLVSVGILVYPIGWGNIEVMEACSQGSGPYQLGTCRISWSIYLMAGGVFLLLVAFGFSRSACKMKKGTYRI